MAGKILVGTSSWSDPGFVEEWYPDGIPARDRLPWYAQRFQAVEVNSTFYAVPDRSTVRRWAEVTPEDFTFDVKAHRALSRHAADRGSLPKDLREEVEVNQRGRVILTPELETELARRLKEETRPLQETGKLGAFLVQLTPAFSPKDHELDELNALVEELGPRPVALELRHRGWVAGKRVEDTLRWYEEHGVTFVGVDAPPEDHVPIMPPIDAATRQDLAYMRAHGRNTQGYMTGRTVAERFAWRYEDDELEEIAGRARVLAEQSSEVHVHFNNNRGDDAPTAAARFRALLGQDPGPPPEDAQLELS
jgi:uncharacterized protein YecE (DUF72 family)